MSQYTSIQTQPDLYPIAEKDCGARLARIRDKAMLDALAADVRREGRLLPGSVLRRLIEGHRPINAGARNIDRALLIASVYHTLCDYLLRDAEAMRLEMDSTVKRWHRRRDTRPLHVLSGQLRLKELPTDRAVILPVCTFGFLGTLPLALLVDIARWAPPVIGKPDEGAKSYAVIENLLSAFLVAQVMPRQRIWVRVLMTHCEARHTILEVAHYAKPMLAAICVAHHDRIIHSFNSWIEPQAKIPDGDQAARKKTRPMQAGQSSEIAAQDFIEAIL